MFQKGGRWNRLLTRPETRNQRGVNLRTWYEKFSASTIDGNNIGKNFFS